jgi:hypothetical protein
VDVSVVPRALLGAVNGVEIVAVGALQFARDVLLSAVSGAANIGAEALAATTVALEAWSRQPPRWSAISRELPRAHFVTR